MGGSDTASESTSPPQVKFWLIGSGLIGDGGGGDDDCSGAIPSALGKTATPITEPPGISVGEERVLAGGPPGCTMDVEIIPRWETVEIAVGVAEKVLVWSFAQLPGISGGGEHVFTGSSESAALTMGVVVKSSRGTVEMARATEWVAEASSFAELPAISGV